MPSTSTFLKSDDKTKQFSILINDEPNEEENDEEDENSNEKPLLDRKDKVKKKTTNAKKGGYYKLSKQEHDNVSELFESSVNAVDFDDDDEYEEDDDEDKEEETNEQTQLTKSKKRRHNDKKSIRKKLFESGGKSSSKQSLIKQSSTDDELSLGKIKILIPRKKNKSKLIRYKIRKCLRNFFSLFFLMGALVVVFLLLYFKRQYLNEFVKDHLSNGPSSSVKRTLDEQSKHCDMLIVNNLWNVSLPKLVVDAPLRLLDVNMDGEMDLMVPFATSIDQTRYNAALCQIYFNQTDVSSSEFVGCGGGLLLLDGQTGEEIWRVYTKHRLNSVNCPLDLDGDNIKDCFATGPRAQFYMISGQTGRIIWRLNAQQGEPIQQNAAFHTPLLLPRDVDEDGINDILVMHGGDYQRKTKASSARMLILSSRQGNILLWSHVPDGQDSYIPPVLFYRNQGKDLDTVEIVYGTGSHYTKGSLWSINLDEFLRKNRKNNLKNSVKIYEDCCKGMLTPPILVDLNKDHIQDIVIAFNSTVAAFNGRTFVELWHMKFGSNTEFYVPPAVGYFDDDDVPDFIVQYELGDGFPNSYYSEVQVLNGQNGKSMLKDPFRMLTGSRSAPITVSVDTKETGKQSSKKTNSTDQTIDSFDLFLFWQTTCSNQEQELKKLTNTEQIDQMKFKLKFNSINELSKTDFCKLRFSDKKTVNRLHSVSFGNIMTTIYDSDERAAKELEQNNKFNWTKIGADYLSKNPDMLFSYMNSINQEDGYLDENGDGLSQLPFIGDKRNPTNYGDQNGFNLNSNGGYYLKDPNNNDRQDFSSFKRTNDFTSFGGQQSQQQDRKGSFSLPNQPNFNLPNLSPNDNPFNQNDLASLLNQLQPKPKLPPPYLAQGFDINNNINNRFQFVKKKSSPPFEDLPLLEQIFQRRRSKRNAPSTDDAEFIHKIYATATLAPSKLEKGIDLMFATNWIPESKSVKLIKKSDYDNCVQKAQKEGQSVFSKGGSLNDYISYCDKQLNKNEETKKPMIDAMLKRQMGSTTIYRNSLKCKNDDFHMRPFASQIWPSYMGLAGNGMAN